MNTPPIDLVARIPHRPPMHWLDSATIDPAGRVTARRTITADHPFLRDQILLPLALIEMLSQTAACGAVAQASDHIIRRGVLASVRNLVFHQQVRVGQTLSLIGVKERSLGSLSLWRLYATVDAQRVVEGHLAFHVELIPLSGAQE